MDRHRAGGARAGDRGERMRTMRRTRVRKIETSRTGRTGARGGAARIDGGADGQCRELTCFDGTAALAQGRTEAKVDKSCCDIGHEKG